MAITMTMMTIASAVVKLEVCYHILARPSLSGETPILADVEVNG
jgi:hypothetical protein